MNAETWARILLADDSDSTLSMWADWLEDQSDAACEGVRWLVETGRARSLRAGTFCFMWKKGELPKDVFKRLSFHNDRWDWKNLRCYDTKVVNGTWTRAEAHYFALLDAARAYAAAIAVRRATQAESSRS
jgi:hypothetical protein